LHGHYRMNDRGTVKWQPVPGRVNVFLKLGRLTDFDRRRWLRANANP